MKNAIRAFAIASILALLSICMAGCMTPIIISDYFPVEFGTEDSDTSLLIIQDDNRKFGYCDASGKIVIEPQYDNALAFHEGLAAVKLGKKYGFIDKTGKTIIPFQYNMALGFHNGRAIVGTEFIVCGEIGYPRCCIIDKTGKILRETDYIGVTNHTGDITCAYDTGDYTYILDENCNEVVKLKLGVPYVYFNEGLAVVYNRDTPMKTYMDAAGNMVFPEKDFYDALPFNEGLAAVMPDQNTKLWGYIDKTGNMAIAPAFAFAGQFGEGLAYVKDAKGEWAIIDKAGKKVITLQIPLEKAYEFSEGLCAVGIYSKENAKHSFNDSNCAWGFMDTSGKLVIDFKYDRVTPFKNGIAEVLLDGKIGYIDKTGKYIWEPK